MGPELRPLGANSNNPTESSWSSIDPKTMAARKRGEGENRSNLSESRDDSWSSVEPTSLQAKKQEVVNDEDRFGVGEFDDVQFVGSRGEHNSKQGNDLNSKCQVTAPTNLVIPKTSSGLMAGARTRFDKNEVKHLSINPTFEQHVNRIDPDSLWKVNPPRNIYAGLI